MGMTHVESDSEHSECDLVFGRRSYETTCSGTTERLHSVDSPP